MNFFFRVPSRFKFIKVHQSISNREKTSLTCLIKISTTKSLRVSAAKLKDCFPGRLTPHSRLLFCERRMSGNSFSHQARSAWNTRMEKVSVTIEQGITTIRPNIIEKSGKFIAEAFC